MTKSCPLCGGSLFVGTRFGLLRCEQCGLVVDISVWRPEANEYLNDVAFGDDYQPVSSFWVRGFEALSNRRRMRLIRRCANSHGRLLEVGVGSGSFLTYAASQGFLSVGCDLSAPICRRVARETGQTVHCGPITALPPEERFDVVVMSHVLEHVTDPVAFLKAARARLKPDGTLFVAVPNAVAWEARLAGWNSYVPYHLVYFAPTTLRLAAEQAGFRVFRVKTHESFSGWVIAAGRTFLGYANRQDQQGREATVRVRRRAWVEHLYRLLLVTTGVLSLPARRVQGWLGYGDELLLVAKSVAHD